MTLDQNLVDFAQETASTDKALRTLINGNAVDLAALLTTDKVSLVRAINELHQAVVAAAQSGGAAIDDAATGASTTWSSAKSAQEIANAAAATSDAILGGAGAAFDTLQELKALLDSSDVADDAALQDLLTAVGNRVRFDAPQALTTQQKAQALQNIGAVAAADVGETDTDLVAIYRAGLL